MSCAGHAVGTPALENATILLVHASSGLYGSDRAALEIVRAARRADVTLEVMVPKEGRLVAELAAIGATVHVVDPLVLRRADLRASRLAATVFRWGRGLVRLRQFARVHRFDLVHTNCATPLGGAMLARWWGVPHLWQVHEVFPDAKMRRAFGYLLRRADLLLGASHAVATQFRDPNIHSKFRVAYTGAQIRSDVSETVPLEGVEREPLITCVGRINAWKGQTVLVEAVALMRKRGVRTRLLLVGDVFEGERRFRERLEREIERLGLQEAVTLAGERRDAIELMARSDIVAVPSIQPEPFGMVVVEAMALGRPVIATAAGGPAEIITHAVDGLLVRPGDAIALADAVERFVRDPIAARQMGEAARTTARRFGPENMTAVVLEAYRDLLGSTCVCRR